MNKGHSKECLPKVLYQNDAELSHALIIAETFNEVSFALALI